MNDINKTVAVMSNDVNCTVYIMKESTTASNIEKGCKLITQCKVHLTSRSLHDERNIIFKADLQYCCNRMKEIMTNQTDLNLDPQYF